MARSTRTQALGPTVRGLFALSTVSAAVSAHALSDADCNAMHTLVDHTFANLDKLLGSQIEREPGKGAIYRVSQPARPFERCEIQELEEDKPARFRLLICDLTAQSGIEPIAGKQSEFSAAVFVKTIQSIADDYSQCFYKRAAGPETKPAKDGRVISTWQWPLTLDVAPAYFAFVGLELKQASVGQEVGTPQIKIRFSRVDRNATGSK